MCKLRGYAKWAVLSQVVKELHPLGISLFELVSTAQGEGDEVYQGLRGHFSDTFLSLKQEEHHSLMMRTGEFKALTKKAILLTFLLLNLTPSKIKQTMTTWTYYTEFLKNLEVMHQQNYKQRMTDW